MQGWDILYVFVDSVLLVQRKKKIKGLVYLALTSMCNRLFDFGLVSGETLTQAMAILRTASIWLLIGIDVLLILKSRMRYNLASCCVANCDTDFANSVPSLTAGFPVSSSRRMTPKL